MEQESESSNCMPPHDNLYPLQHFGTNAEDLTDRVFNLSVDVFLQLFSTTHNSLQEFFGGDFPVAGDLQPTIQNLVKEFYGVLDVKSEILEKYLQKVVLNVPSNALVPEALVHKQYVDSKRTLLETEKEIKLVSSNIKQTRQLKCELLKKLERSNALEGKLLNLLKESQNGANLCEKSNLKEFFRDFVSISNTVSTLDK